MFKNSTIIASNLSMMVSKTTICIGWKISKFFFKNGFNLSKTTITKLYSIGSYALKSVKRDTQLVNFFVNSKKNFNIIFEKRIFNNAYDSLSTVTRKIKQYNEKSNKILVPRNKRLKISDQNLYILNEWYDSNINNPYLSSKNKKILAKKSNLTENQITKWLQNKRARSSKPKRSKRVSIETKKILKSTFLLNRYPKNYKLKEMALKTGLSVKKIRLWFAYERFKLKVT